MRISPFTILNNKKKDKQFNGLILGIFKMPQGQKAGGEVEQLVLASPGSWLPFHLEGFLKAPWLASKHNQHPEAPPALVMVRPPSGAHGNQGGSRGPEDQGHGLQEEPLLHSTWARLPFDSIGVTSTAPFLGPTPYSGPSPEHLGGQRRTARWH